MNTCRLCGGTATRDVVDWASDDGACFIGTDEQLVCDGCSARHLAETVVRTEGRRIVARGRRPPHRNS